MKLTLRLRYLGWMLLLLFGSNLILIVSLLVFNLNEALVLGENQQEEVEEFFFMTAVLLMLLPVLIWGAHVVVGRLMQPLDKILNTAEDIRSGDLGVRIPPIDADARLNRLGEMINQAFDRYASAMFKLESFSINASHQLRTPIAAIHNSAEVALFKRQTPEVYEETFAEILAQSDKLKKVVEQMLLLARIDGMNEEEFQSVQLCEEVRSCMDAYKSAAEGMGIELELVCGTRMAVRGNVILLREALINLLENALAHTPDDGRIRVSLMRIEGKDEQIYFRISVEDSGRGIPQTHWERIFERFYRLEGSKSEGSGLGLAIVRTITHLHKGTVHVGQSESLGGAELILEFPAIDQTAVAE